MRINVAALGGRVQTYVQDDASLQTPWIEISLVCLPRFADYSELDRPIHQLPESLRHNAQAIFLRVHPGEESDLLPRNGEMSLAVEMLHRRSRVPIYMVHWEVDRHRVTPLTNGEPIADDLSASLLKHFARGELAAYGADRRARLPRSTAFHYEGPNGLHYQSFLRVATALQSPDQLDGACFWLLPFLEPQTVVILDTSTISVLGLHLGQYIRETGLSTYASVLLVQPMRGYDSDAVESLARRIETALPDRQSRLHALVIISTISTGSLALRGRNFAQQLQFDSITALGLYGSDLEEQDIQQGHLDAVLCPLTKPLGRVESKECPDCNRHPRGSSPALRISPNSYLLEISQSLATTELRSAELEPAMELMERYPGSGAFAVHRDEPLRGLPRPSRHHGIYIDVEHLAEIEVFRDRFDAKLDELRGQVDVILSPEHDAAKVLARRAADKLGVDLVIQNAESISQLNIDNAAAIRRKRLLIVDDAIITGDRLRGYRQAFLELEIGHESVHVLVGVCRPVNTESHLGIANVVHQMGLREMQLHAVEQVLLPNWANEQCPWCWEHELIAEHGRDGEEISRKLIERYEHLTPSGDGLTDHLFWGWDTDIFPLGPGSVLGPESMTQAQIFTVVASAMQTLRSGGDLDEEFTPPISKVLLPDFWLKGRFYAPAITAAILRASYAHDLTTPLPGRRYKKQVSERLLEQPSRNLRAEFLLAVVAGKLPVVPAVVMDSLTDGEIDDGVLALFAQLLGLADQ